jgi:PAS domain S-box-containing protein
MATWQKRPVTWLALGVGSGCALELYCIWAYFFYPDFLLNAALSFLASIVITTTILVCLRVMGARRAPSLWAVLASLLYVSYKALDVYMTYRQANPSAWSPSLIEYDELIQNTLLLLGVIALLASMVVALRESQTARFALQQKNDALEKEMERRQAYARELEESRERFLQIADQTHEVIWEIDANGLYTYMSRAITPMTGYSPEDLVGKTFFYELYPEAGREAFREQTMAAIRRGETFRDFLNPMVGRDGRLVEVLTSGLPVLDDAGALLGYRGSDRDVTETRQAEERERLLSTAIENAAESIVITDRAGVIQYVNSAFEALTGYSRAEAAGAKPDILHSGSHDRAFYQELWETLLRGEVWRGYFINKRKDGRLFEEGATISPILDGSGAITHFVAVKRDVTRERHLERQLRQAAKLEAAGTLASGIAHNLNSVLALVAGHAEVARDQLPPDHLLRPSMEIILRSGYNASRLLKKLLAFSRHQPHTAEPTQVAPLIQDTLALLTAQVPASVKIEAVIEEDAGMVLADPGDVQQVVINLCTNALAAMPQGGLLEIRLEPCLPPGDVIPCVGTFTEGECLRIRVRDTGIGIPPEYRERIFEPFFSSGTGTEGNGLGLATVASIVLNWHGAVIMDSAVNGGTTFDIFIPRLNP